MSGDPKWLYLESFHSPVSSVKKRLAALTTIVKQLKVLFGRFH
jgi:hypothetical protein